MKDKLFILLFAVAFTSAGCYLPMSGRVIDAETNKPIEGAVVLVEWTKTKGFGFTYTESYKVAETTSDRNGKFELPGCYSAFVNEPDLTIYKKGYAAWSSRWIFPGMRVRTDFKWGNSTYTLEHFKEEYSYIDHTDFISTSINSSSNNKAKKTFYSVYGWEEQMASKERDKKANKLH